MKKIAALLTIAVMVVNIIFAIGIPVNAQTASFDPIWPTTGYTVTALYYYSSGEPHLKINGRDTHNAIDIAPGKGEPVYAIESGTVYDVRTETAAGNIIIVKHSNGQTSRYQHLQTMSVNKGDSVTKGQTIGTVGDSGTAAKGSPHLHFEYSGGDLFDDYYKSKYGDKIIFHTWVYDGNTIKYNSDAKSKALIDWINMYYAKSGNWYVRNSTPVTVSIVPHSTTKLWKAGDNWLCPGFKVEVPGHQNSKITTVGYKITSLEGRTLIDYSERFNSEGCIPLGNSYVYFGMASDLSYNLDDESYVTDIKYYSFVTLASGHTYNVQGFVTYDGVVYYSDVYTMSTTGETKHNWNVLNITWSTDCTTPETRTYSCDCCNETNPDSEIIPAPGHSFGSEWSSDSTNHWHVCSRCNEKGDLSSHTWDAGVVSRPATETVEGIMTYTCTTCSQTKTEIIEPIIHIHDYTALWESDEINHWHECSCGEKADIAAHEWDEGKVTKPATETAEGIMTYTCTACMKTKDEVIPKLIPITGSRVVVGNITGKPGDTVDLTITLAETPEINFIMIYDIMYDDSKVELISAEWLEKGPDDSNYDSSENVMYKDIGSNVADLNGTVARITLKIKENIDDCETSVNLQCVALNLDSRFDIDAVEGTVSIINVMRGDFNNDGKLSAADAIYLKKHIALPSRYPLNQNGDLDGDGTVTAKDALHLKRHIALPSRYPLH